MESEAKFIEQCRLLIEEQLNWGSSDVWTNQDFESLSQAIFQKTNVNLSQSTLKRIWGKVKYDSAPTPTTLNTLAQFLGFDHWLAFRQAQLQKNSKVSLKELPAPKKKLPVFIFFAILVMVGCLALTKGFFLKDTAKVIGDLNPSDFKFESRKIVPNSIPNSVVFDYDATASPVDSVFIRQSWDPALTVQVPKDKQQHTSIYYYPGFFEAKLLVGGKIIKQNEVYIKTDGWMPLIEQEPVPIYFKKEEAIKNGTMTLPVADIIKKNISLEPVAPFVSYLNFRSFGNLQTDDFEFETAVKNDYKEGSAICQNTQIRIMCKGSAIFIPLSAKGCISENNLYCLGQLIKGKEHDLSGFGADFNKFIKVKVRIVKGAADFYVNDKLTYHLDHVDRSSPVVGIVYRFQGSGSVDYVKMSDGKGNVIYNEGF